jgi:hypothetical protein
MQKQTPPDPLPITGLIWPMSRRQYADRWGDPGYCQACGRKVGRRPRWLIVVDGGAAAAKPDDVHHYSGDSGYMGAFPIGSECAKQFPSDYLIQIDQIKETSR